jgi:hypothetical protein
VGELFGQTDGDRGGSPPATKTQVPGADVVLQDLQVSVQAVLQQTPSMQNPLAQSALQPHVEPFGMAPPASRPHVAESLPASRLLGARPCELHPMVASRPAQIARTHTGSETAGEPQEFRDLRGTGATINCEGRYGNLESTKLVR